MKSSIKTKLSACDKLAFSLLEIICCISLGVVITFAATQFLRNMSLDWNKKYERANQSSGMRKVISLMKSQIQQIDISQPFCIGYDEGSSSNAVSFYTYWSDLLCSDIEGKRLVEYFVESEGSSRSLQFRLDRNYSRKLLKLSNDETVVFNWICWDYEANTYAFHSSVRPFEGVEVPLGLRVQVFSSSSDSLEAKFSHNFFWLNFPKNT